MNCPAIVFFSAALDLTSLAIGLVLGSLSTLLLQYLALLTCRRRGEAALEPEPDGSPAARPLLRPSRPPTSADRAA